MEKAIKIIAKINHKINSFFYGFLLHKLGEKSVLCYPFSVDNAKNIEIGKRVYIKPNAWFISVAQSDSVSLKVGDNSYIGRNAHFVSMKEVIVGKDVLIADNVFISDNIHQYDDITVPIKDQPLCFKGAVTIGDQSWLGENVSVIGCSIGKHCVIGANSVITSNIPDYSIAVGSPAKVIKTYDFKTKDWLKV
jgi:acetyltransferase-like isoleucine patch superfamily enzyme